MNLVKVAEVTSDEIDTKKINCRKVISGDSAGITLQTIRKDEFYIIKENFLLSPGSDDEHKVLYQQNMEIIDKTHPFHSEYMKILNS